MTTATPKPRAGEHVRDADPDDRDREAWMHAACLTIAETGQKWGENVHPSAAMQAVFKLRAERDRLREREKALVEVLEQFCGFVSAGCAETGTIAAYRITLSAIHEKARVLLAKVTT